MSQSGDQNSETCVLHIETHNDHNEGLETCQERCYVLLKYEGEGRRRWGEKHLLKIYPLSYNFKIPKLSTASQVSRKALYLRVQGSKNS